MVQKTLIPEYVIELRRIEREISKLEDRVWLLAHEFKALDAELKSLGVARDG